MMDGTPMRGCADVGCEFAGRVGDGRIRITRCIAYRARSFDLRLHSFARGVSVEDNIEVVRKLNQALTTRDWAAFDALVAEGCEWKDVPSGRMIRGVKELVDSCRTFTTAFPDFSVESVTLIGQGDLVATEWSGHGTHDGPLPRPDGGYVEPTGRSFARTGVGIVELRDGKIVRYREYFDRQTMTEQLGLE